MVCGGCRAARKSWIDAGEARGKLGCSGCSSWAVPRHTKKTCNPAGLDVLVMRGFFGVQEQQPEGREEGKKKEIDHLQPTERCALDLPQGAALTQPTKAKFSVLGLLLWWWYVKSFLFISVPASLTASKDADTILECRQNRLAKARWAVMVAGVG